MLTKKENKKLPDFKSLDELGEFFDNNDLGDYIDDMPEAQFEISIKKDNVCQKTNEKSIHNRRL